MHVYEIFPAIGDCYALAVLCLQDISKSSGVTTVDGLPEEENSMPSFVSFALVLCMLQSLATIRKI